MNLLKLTAGCLICTMFCSDCFGMRRKHNSRIHRSHWKTIIVCDGRDNILFNLNNQGNLKKDALANAPQVDKGTFIFGGEINNILDLDNPYYFHDVIFQDNLFDGQFDFNGDLI